MAGQSGTQSQIAAGHDDCGPESTIRTGCARWTVLGLCRLFETAAALADAIAAIPGLHVSRLLLFGGWESASRGLRFHAPDRRRKTRYHRSNSWGSTNSTSFPMAAWKFWSAWPAANTRCQSVRLLPQCSAGPPVTSPCPAIIRKSGWRTCDWRCRRCNAPKAAGVKSTGLCFQGVTLPKQQRETRIVKDMPPAEIAREIVTWIAEK